jgi:hypothetical protein
MLGSHSPDLTKVKAHNGQCHLVTAIPGISSITAFHRQPGRAGSRSVQASHLPVSSLDSWARNLHQVNAIGEFERVSTRTPETAKVLKVSTTPRQLVQHLIKHSGVTIFGNPCSIRP